MTASEERIQDELGSAAARRMQFLERYGVFAMVVVMMVVLTILQPDVFPTTQNLTNILRQIAMNALLALGLYVVILTAGIDLSVGSIMAFATMLLAMADTSGFFPWPLAILVGPLVGVACGLVNGMGLTVLRLPHPFIMTLGTLYTLRGLTNLVSSGRPISGVSPEVRFLGSGEIPMPFLGEYGSLPVSAFVVLASYVGVAFFLNKVSLGRHIVAVGGNPQAARVSGINVNRVLLVVYGISGFFAGLAALLMAGRTGSGFPNAGIGAELDAIAAVIIGGASFFGGRGTVLGVFAGVLVMGLLRNGLNIMNVSAFWQQTLIGMIVVGAVYVDVLRRRAGSDQ
ncbi:ABC transporter permease [Hoeflea prorocentri]|uniref:ABC transporter permease n=1 Tax=Hoeflea prorocentri TaxID=1922333 RepID=A0A9X3UFT0_9HYPH|nr:ABC transporter permease [Hoeflea prorocentri]MCY6379745.1 ABC transporter permease [Hoeflea prorocentri]MDA5397545.1 ABC transporter permease [Hoeflea prorocentri]